VSDIVRLFILDTAQDEPLFWDLTEGLEWVSRGQRELLYPPMPVDEVRPVLKTMIQEGLVQVYDVLSPEQLTTAQ
jgi:hypothetical protein